MHLITPLACGIAGAGGGTAKIYQRGTSTKASYYTDAEASGSASTADITLDANGGAVVFVNEYVDVTVLSSSGGTVRSFTDMGSASSIEVRSASFTGTDYETGDSASGNPVDLNSLLGRWNTSAGTSAVSVTDFNVAFNGASSTLAAALGIVTGTPWFNVQDATYGATGDGTTDDSTAVSAAISAADAANGVVFFPPGTYRVTSELAPTTSSLIGCGPGASIIQIDDSAATAINFGASSYRVAMIGLRVEAAQTTTGYLLAVGGATSLSVSDCHFDGSNSAAMMRGIVAATMRVSVTDCHFALGAANDAVDWATPNGGTLHMERCHFVTPATYSSSNGMVYGLRTHLRSCVFDLSASTSGTIQCYVSSSTTLDASVVGCRFISSGGATVTGMTLGTYLDGSSFIESGNQMPDFQDANFTAYSYTHAIASSTTLHGDVILATREDRYIVVQENTGTGGVDMMTYTKQFGHVVVRNNSGSAGMNYNVQTVADRLPSGATLRFAIYADGSGLTAYANVSGGGGSHAITANRRTLYYIVSQQISAYVIAENQNVA